MPYENCERRPTQNNKTCMEFHGDDGVKVGLWCDPCLRERTIMREKRELLLEVFEEVREVFDAKIQDLT